MLSSDSEKTQQYLTTLRAQKLKRLARSSHPTRSDRLRRVPRRRSQDPQVTPARQNPLSALLCRHHLGVLPIPSTVAQAPQGSLDPRWPFQLPTASETVPTIVIAVPVMTLPNSSPVFSFPEELLKPTSLFSCVSAPDLAKDKHFHTHTQLTPAWLHRQAGVSFCTTPRTHSA